MFSEGTPLTNNAWPLELLAKPKARTVTRLPINGSIRAQISGDGWYVMRRPEILGTYKDLTAGQIVQQSQQSG